MTKSPIATTCTYDSRELTSKGWDVEIFADYVILTYESKWQGDRPGTKYKAAPVPPEVLAAAMRDEAGEDHEHEPDLESAVQEWLSTADESEWKLIRRGGKIG
jgi:hypothetical protein